MARKTQSAPFKPVTLTHADGRTRTAHNQRAVVQAEWDGFAVDKASLKDAEKLSTAASTAAVTGDPAPSAPATPTTGKRS